MNAIDYFFEHTLDLTKPFLVGKETISFQDLYNTCLNHASRLRTRIGYQKHILLLSPNNLFFLQSYLSIIKSGNICIPLDPSIEKDNFQYIFDLTQPAAVYLTRDVEAKLGFDSDISVYPESLSGETVPDQHTGMENEFDADLCAEIIFTSGSTGKPKGVMISHKNLITNTSSIVEYLQLSRDDRMLVVLPFYYCYGLSLLHTHLRVGGSIVFNNSFIFLGGVLKSLIDYRCTGFAGVPSHFQILLRKSDSFKQTRFPDLKYVTQAGGKLAPIFIDEFRESHPDIRFIVMYGQTEATARLSWLPPELYSSRKGSIGKGIPGVELKVVNEAGEQIRPGETGELIARGGNIMLGYFAEEEWTNKTIRNGWLYTGDLGTVDEDGFIYLTARSKEIIKVRGKRISPKEIEAVILALPEIIDCTIEGIDHEIEGETLKATITVRKDSIDLVTEEKIIQHCSQHLSLYKVPKVIEFKDDLFISPTGKKIKKS
ncbi:MAG TPA: AMP-binding protein [Spirochaetota bacterium]|jgi:acyl-CoA synthetase (AMP-forming)/AMP-acid ligase II|nr:AMP-binding protein [Spirochaetota bacterium]